MANQGGEGWIGTPIQVFAQSLKKPNRARVLKESAPGEAVGDPHPGKAPLHEGNQIRIRHPDHDLLRRKSASETREDGYGGPGLIPGMLDDPDLFVFDGDVGPLPCLRKNASEGVETGPCESSGAWIRARTGPGRAATISPTIRGSSTTPTIQTSPGEESLSSSRACFRSRSRSLTPDSRSTSK